MPEENDSITNNHALTNEQTATLALLVSGLSPSAAGKQLGLARETISRWRHHHPVFREEYERQVKDVRGEALERVALLASEAIDELCKLLQDDDPRIRCDVIRMILQATRIIGPETKVKVEVDSGALRSLSSEQLRAAVEQLAAQRQKAAAPGDQAYK